MRLKSACTLRAAAVVENGMNYKAGDVLSTAFFVMSDFPIALKTTGLQPSTPSPSRAILPSERPWVVSNTLSYLNSKINRLSVTSKATKCQISRIRFSLVVNYNYFKVKVRERSSWWWKVGMWAQVSNNFPCPSIQYILFSSPTLSTAR